MQLKDKQIRVSFESWKKLKLIATQTKIPIKHLADEAMKRFSKFKRTYFK